MSFDDLIDLLTMFKNAADEVLHKLIAILVGTEVFTKLREAFDRILPGKIPLIKNLESKLPRFSPFSQPASCLNLNVAINRQNRPGGSARGNCQV